MLAARFEIITKQWMNDVDPRDASSNCTFFRLHFGLLVWSQYFHRDLPVGYSALKVVDHQFCPLTAKTQLLPGYAQLYVV
jgi:hypothetical protein